jgi:hypothetical protein
MPYINRHDRTAIQEGFRRPTTAGELNFLITTIIKDFYDEDPCYQTINDVVGALEGAKIEFYRRVAAPYEDLKIKENGDVY